MLKLIFKIFCTLMVMHGNTFVCLCTYIMGLRCSIFNMKYAMSDMNNRHQFQSIQRTKSIYKN